MHGPARPKMTLKRLTENDRRELKLTNVYPQETNIRRSRVRSAMPVASQLPGGGPLMCMISLHLHIN